MVLLAREARSARLLAAWGNSFPGCFKWLRLLLSRRGAFLGPAGIRRLLTHKGWEEPGNEADGKDQDANSPETGPGGSE